MISGLFYVVSWVHHDVYFTYSRVIKIDNGTIYVRLNFTTQDAFIAQKSIDVHAQIFEMGLVYPNGTVVPSPPPLSNDLRIGTYYVVIVDAKKPYESFPDVIQNYTGALFTPAVLQQKPTLQIAGDDKVVFPLAGDYVGYLLVTTYPEKTISLGRVMNVSPPEASLQVASNNIGSGLSMIVVGLTIVQIGLVLHTRTKPITHNSTNHPMEAPPRGSDMPEESLRIQKQITYLGIYTTAGMSIGASIFSVGLAILFSLGPFIAENEHTGFTPFDESVFNSQLFASHYFIVIGLVMIVITGIGSMARTKTLKLNQSNSTSTSINVQHENVSSNKDWTYVSAPPDISRH